MGNKTGPGKSCVAVTESKPKLILETDKNLDWNKIDWMKYYKLPNYS